MRFTRQEGVVLPQILLFLSIIHVLLAACANALGGSKREVAQMQIWRSQANIGGWTGNHRTGSR